VAASAGKDPIAVVESEEPLLSDPEIVLLGLMVAAGVPAPARQFDGLTRALGESLMGIESRLG